MKKQIKYYSGVKYWLAETYTHQTKITSYNIKTKWIDLNSTGLLTIHEGYASDGPSGPTIDTSDAMRGGWVHDALYNLMRMGLLPLNEREKADKELEDICREDGMGELRAEVWDWAVERFARSAATIKGNLPLHIAP